MALRDQLTQAEGQSATTAKLIATANAQAHPAALIAQEANAAPILAQLFDTVSTCVDGVDHFTFDQLAEMLRDMREGLEDLPDILPILADIQAADPNFSFALRSVPLALPELEALIVDESIARMERANPEIRRFDIERLIAVTRRAASARDVLREENVDIPGHAN